MLRDVFFLSCGEFISPTVALAPPRALLSSPAFTRMSNTVAVAVRESGEMVLVDAGWSLATCQDPLRVLGRVRLASVAPKVRPEDAIVSQLRSLGLDPSRVTAVVATHMHLDHIGGVSDFPNAELVLSHRELSAFYGFPPNPGYRSTDLAKDGRIRMLPVEGAPRHGFRASADLFGDGSVVLLDARGHTKGAVAVELTAPTGAYLHVGDAVYQSWEYGTEPAGPSLFARIIAWDRKELRNAYASIREHGAAVPTATVVSSHDARVFDRLPHSPALSA